MFFIFCFPLTSPLIFRGKNLPKMFLLCSFISLLYFFIYFIFFRQFKFNVEARSKKIKPWTSSRRGSLIEIAKKLRNETDATEVGAGGNGNEKGNLFAFFDSNSNVWRFHFVWWACTCRIFFFLLVLFFAVLIFYIHSAEATESMLLPHIQSHLHSSAFDCTLVFEKIYSGSGKIWWRLRSVKSVELSSRFI